MHSQVLILKTIKVDSELERHTRNKTLIIINDVFKVRNYYRQMKCEVELGSWLFNYELQIANYPF